WWSMCSSTTVLTPSLAMKTATCLPTAHRRRYVVLPPARTTSHGTAHWVCVSGAATQTPRALVLPPPVCAFGFTICGTRARASLCARLQGACSVAFSVDKDMAAPVFVYYQLENFYQNHRRYVKSRSDSQLSGTVYTDKAGVSECDPLFFAPNSTKLLDPCGLIANSYFTGTRLRCACTLARSALRTRPRAHSPTSPSLRARLQTRSRCNRAARI
ncbi:hypothetical protein EON67_03770, partial [archaeon]